MTEARATQTRKSLFLLMLIVVLFIALRFRGISRYGLWLDETFSEYMVKLGWSELIRNAVADIVHPPFFYVLLKLWVTIGGHSLVSLKVFPVSCHASP